MDFCGCDAVTHTGADGVISKKPVGLFLHPALNPGRTHGTLHAHLTISHFLHLKIFWEFPADWVSLYLLFQLYKHTGTLWVGQLAQKANIWTVDPSSVCPRDKLHSPMEIQFLLLTLINKHFDCVCIDWCLHGTALSLQASFKFFTYFATLQPFLHVCVLDGGNPVATM